MAQDSGERWHLAPAAARLAIVLCAQGRLDDAAELASLSARQAPAEGVEAQALSRVARSEVCSSAGDHDQAVELAREAVDLVPDTMPNLLGEALTTLGRVLSVANLPGADSTRSDAPSPATCARGTSPQCRHFVLPAKEAHAAYESCRRLIHD
jgi:tetratricopeptide (TPR) repeat protein